MDQRQDAVIVDDLPSCQAVTVTESITVSLLFPHRARAVGFVSTTPALALINYQIAVINDLSGGSIVLLRSTMTVGPWDFPHAVTQYLHVDSRRGSKLFTLNSTSQSEHKYASQGFRF